MRFFLCENIKADAIVPPVGTSVRPVLAGGRRTTRLDGARGQRSLRESSRERKTPPKMWQMRYASATLIVASLCLVSGQQQPGSTGNIDDLIGSVFKPPEKTSTSNPSGNLGDLISGVFNDQNKNENNQNGGNFGSSGNIGTSGTFLGVDNQNTANTDRCECVPYYQCQNGTILDNGIGLIDIRLSGPCDNYLDICCKAPDIVRPDEKITPPPLERKGCGQRHPDGVGFRITGATDNEAQFGEFPWMVAILQEEIVNNQQTGNSDRLNVYQCGGALIHPRAVLTAAHCVNGKRPEQLKIRAGEWDTQTKTEIFPHQDRNVSKVIVHEKFNSGALHNDFAILILQTAVELAENVDVVCLPERDARFDASRCFASGWGKNIFGKEGKYQVILKKIDLPVISHDVCQNTLRNTRLGRYYALDPSFICAGGEPGKDTCKGDGGSPLVCPLRSDPSRYVQAGIVAWGIGCGENGVPGVYANVAGARRWIDEQIAYNNLDTTVYQYYP